MAAFNAKASRAKRPCPIWVDAFQRDTQHLEADEIGAYFLILMAMWTRETCDFPDDDHRLARVSRVSSRLWKSRIGPVIRAFLTAGDGVVFSKRLREEATYTERQVKQQSDRKVGEKHDKPLKCKEPHKSADISVDEPGNYPTQQPNYPTLDDDDDRSAGGREPDGLMARACAAAGTEFGSLTGSGGRFGMAPKEVDALRRWQQDLGLTPAQIIASITDQASRLRSPPRSLTYFTPGLQQLAAELTAHPLQPAPHEVNHDRQPARDRREATAADRHQRIILAAATARSPSR